jgi:hypothetical protein
MNEIKVIKSLPPEQIDLESVYLAIITGFSEIPKDGLVWVIVKSIDSGDHRGKLIAMDKDSAVIRTDGDTANNELPSTMLIRNVVKITCHH